MQKEQAPGKPTTRRYSDSEEEKAAAVRMVPTLRSESVTAQGQCRGSSRRSGMGRVGADLGEAGRCRPLTRFAAGSCRTSTATAAATMIRRIGSATYCELARSTSPTDREDVGSGVATP